MTKKKVGEKKQSKIGEVITVNTLRCAKNYMSRFKMQTDSKPLP